MSLLIQSRPPPLLILVVFKTYVKQKLSYHNHVTRLNKLLSIIIINTTHWYKLTLQKCLFFIIVLYGGVYIIHAFIIKTDYILFTNII